LAVLQPIVQLIGHALQITNIDCSAALSNRVIKCDSNLILVRNSYSALHLLDDINFAEYTMADENKKPHECQTDIKKMLRERPDLTHHSST